MPDFKPDPAPTTAQAARTLSLIVPVFNEEDAVAPFLTAVTPHLSACRQLIGPASRVEILFVDDGSTDGTLQAIERLAAAEMSLKIIKLTRNFGKEAALSAGLAFATGDAVIPMDVDQQDPPDLLPQMVEAWVKGALIVNAVRVDRSSDDMFKRSTARAFYKIYNRLSHDPIEPNVGDYRLLDREVINKINEMPERTRFMKGLFSWFGYDQARVEYRRPERAAGTTKWRFWTLWNFALDGITASSTLPLRIWTYFGGALALLAILYAAAIVGRTLLFGVDVPGYASLMAVVLTLGAVNFIAIGILGEYVGRIAVEVRQRPLYVVDRVLEVAPEGDMRSAQ